MTTDYDHTNAGAKVAIDHGDDTPDLVFNCCSREACRKFHFHLPSQPESANLDAKVVLAIVRMDGHGGSSVVITGPISALAKSAV